MYCYYHLFCIFSASIIDITGSPDSHNGNDDDYQCDNEDVGDGDDHNDHHDSDNRWTDR